jgi:hypothetical protein
MAVEPGLSRGSPQHPEDEIETTHYIIALDPATGAIRRLHNKASGRERASAENSLARFSYQTLSQADYERFLANYIISHADWVIKDFGKPNIDRVGARSRTWIPKLSEVSILKNASGHTILATLAIQDTESQKSGLAAFPAKMCLELKLPDAEPAVKLSFYWFNKPAPRLPEAMWLTFNPVVSAPDRWMLDKSEQNISPFDVVANGERHMHAVTSGFTCRNGNDTFDVETEDAPLITLESRSPLNFSQEQPDLTAGIHSCLFNNAWGTNYVMWFNEDMRFRFVIRG